MNTVVVGDIHGQYEIVDKIVALGMPTVFVGDFLDSFTRSPEDCVRALMTAMEYSKATIIYGNHERSYLDVHMRCSGYTKRTQLFVWSLRPRISERFIDYTYCEGFLISHAGVSASLLEDREETLEEYLNKDDFDQIGRSRGGRSRVGGLYWCDWNRDFEPLSDVPQIVGHTRGSGIRQNGNSYCIDCLEDTDQSVLFIGDGTAEVVSLEDL